jgi:hypothetical protein
MAFMAKNDIKPTSTAKAEAVPARIPEPTGTTCNPHRICHKLTVKDRAEDGLTVTFDIEPDIAKRLRRKAGGQDLALFLWENVIYRNIVAAVY